MKGVAAAVAALLFGSQQRQDWGLVLVTPAVQPALVASHPQIWPLVAQGTLSAMVAAQSGGGVAVGKVGGVVGKLNAQAVHT